jgi:shikimate kinase
MSSPHDGPIWIVGVPGAGKSTVGRRLARRLGRPFIDLDRRIEAAAGCTIAAIFSREGEKSFRDRESLALAAAARRRGVAPVVACGGGVVKRPANRRLLASHGTVLWLDLPVTQALARCALQPGRRPLLANRRAYRRRLARRLPHYRALGRRVAAAGAVVLVVDRALAALARRR